MSLFFKMFLTFFITSNCVCQTSIETCFNSVHIGRNQSINWRKQSKNIYFYAGIKYHINIPENIPTSVFFKKTALPKDMEHFGSQIGFGYYFFKNNFCKLGLFYDNQISFLSVKHIMYYAYEPLVENPQSEEDFSYTKSEKIFGPVLFIENSIGLEINTKITERIYLSNRFGMGFLYWKNTDDNFMILSGKNGNSGIEFTRMYSIGIGYSLIKK